MRRAMILAALLAAGGCVSEGARLGARRAQAYAARRGAEGDALGAAVAAELAEVNFELGADAVPLESVELTPEACAAGAAAIRAERAEEASGGGLLGQALALAGLGGLGGLAAAAVRLVQRGRALAGARKALGAAVTLTQQVKERLAGGGLSPESFREIYDAAQRQGAGFVDGSRELYAEYQRMKAGWKSADADAGAGAGPAGSAG